MPKKRCNTVSQLDMDHEVRFVLQDTEWSLKVAEGTSLLDASRVCDAPVQTLCNGIGACVQCRVKVIAGKDNLNLPTSLERDRLGNVFHITGERMGCQATVHGPVTIEPLPARLPKKKRPRGPRPR